MAILDHLSVILVAFTLIASQPATQTRQDCNGFAFTVELTKNPNQELYDITIVASGGKQPYHYLLLDSKHNLISKDFSKRVFSGLKKDRYRCIVSDDQDCTKEQFIEAK